MSSALSACILIASIVLLVILSYKGLGQVIAPIICVAVVSLISNAGFQTSFFTTFPEGAGGFVKSMLLPVMGGSILGEVMNASGAGKAIGGTISRLLGKDNSYIIVMVTSFIVALSGMSSSMFLMAALSHVVMKEADLPSYVGLVSFLSIKEISAFTIPGLPHANNLLPTTYFDTDLYAGSVPGLIAFVAGIALSVLYVRYLVKQARKEGRGYENIYTETKNELDTEENTPSFAAAIIPFLCIIIVTYILQKGLNMKSSVAAFSTQLFSILLMMLLCRKNFRIPIADALLAGIKRGGEFIIPAACLAGFASVVSDTPIFESLTKWLSGINMNPYLFTLIAVSVLASITCDATSALLMFCQTFADTLKAIPGVNLGFIHRIACITCTGFDSLPQGSVALLVLKLFGYDHKSGYKYLCMASLILPFVSAIICTIASMILG